MAEFFTRVELHGVSPDYTQLHQDMARNGFAREATDSTGTRFQLPSATYYSSYSQPTTAEMVRTTAKAIGDNIAAGCWVLVSEAGNWSGWLLKL